MTCLVTQLPCDVQGHRKSELQLFCAMLQTCDDMAHVCGHQEVVSCLAFLKACLPSEDLYTLFLFHTVPREE